MKKLVILITFFYGLCFSQSQIEKTLIGQWEFVGEYNSDNKRVIIDFYDNNIIFLSFYDSGNYLKQIQKKKKKKKKDLDFGKWEISKNFELLTLSKKPKKSNVQYNSSSIKITSKENSENNWINKKIITLTKNRLVLYNKFHNTKMVYIKIK